MTDTNNMFPEKGVKCHRTFAREAGPLDCRTLVCEHGCKLWKRVTLEHHPETGAPGVAHYDCMDSIIDLYLKDMLRRQVQTTATVDKLSKEVREANDSGMANALMGLNQQVRRMEQQAAIPFDAPKLIGNGTGE